MANHEGKQATTAAQIRLERESQMGAHLMWCQNCNKPHVITIIIILRRAPPVKRIDALQQHYCLTAITQKGLPIIKALRLLMCHPSTLLLFRDLSCFICNPSHSSTKGLWLCVQRCMCCRGSLNPNNAVSVTISGTVVASSRTIIIRASRSLATALS